MNAKNSVVSIFLLSLASMIAIACNTKSGDPTTISVNQDVQVAIYSTSEKGSIVDTISPCLMEETVHISDLLHYPGDEWVTMPFCLPDTTKYAEITESNLGKRIAIAINGQVVYTPVVKMRLDNGACSVILDETQTKKLFPNANIKGLISTKH